MPPLLAACTSQHSPFLAIFTKTPEAAHKCKEFQEIVAQLFICHLLSIPCCGLCQLAPFAFRNAGGAQVKGGTTKLKEKDHQQKDRVSA